MKVLHSSLRYFPDRGGSETYISSLIRGLTARGVENVVASAGEPPAEFAHEGITIYRLGDVNSTMIMHEQKASPDYISRLHGLVDKLDPDILHFHWQPGAIARDLSAGWRPGCPMILTYHHPAISCPRGDLIRFGERLCSGALQTQLCRPCQAHFLGATKSVASTLACIPEGLSRRISGLLPQGKLQTALYLGSAIAERIANTQTFLNAFDRIFVLSEWARSMLLLCGLPPSRLILSRLGTHHADQAAPSDKSPRVSEGRIRGIFVGRLDRTKGVFILAQAMSRLQHLPLEIDVFGPLEGMDPRLEPYMKADGIYNSNLRFRGTLKDADVVSTMRQYDFAVVCSQFFETGPYTVIEAFQAGLPVLGTDIGGINEMVIHDQNGWLVPFASVSGWTKVLTKVAIEQKTLLRWSKQAKWVRSMDDVAQEVCSIYASLTKIPNVSKKSGPKVLTVNAKFNSE